MKKILKTVFYCIFIAAIVYAYKYTTILNFVKIDNSAYQIESKYENKFYYEKLSEKEKFIYLNIANSVEKLAIDVDVKQRKTNKENNIAQDINNAMEAFCDDNPEVFYLLNTYNIEIKNYIIINTINIKLSYIANKENIEEMKIKFENKINQITDKYIESGMTDYQKELIVHDYIASATTYYKYKKIEEIPFAKHNAYDALINKSAVCDGFSKAFQVIMNRQNIECISLSGTLEDVAHAWNIITIEGKTYHTDVTSDKYKSRDNDDFGVNHAYFNVTDKDISETHTINRPKIIPKCTATKYNYYIKEDAIIKTDDNFENKLNDIVLNNTNKKLLELRIDSKENRAQKLIQSLYDINFNNLQSTNTSRVTYNLIRDIYIIPI